jgi:hypothetical protein
VTPKTRIDVDEKKTICDIFIAGKSYESQCNDEAVGRVLSMNKIGLVIHRNPGIYAVVCQKARRKREKIKATETGTKLQRSRAAVATMYAINKMFFFSHTFS